MLLRLTPVTLAWRLAMLAFTLMFVSTSVKSLYQIYFVGLAHHFDVARSTMAWSGSLFLLMAGIMSPVAGAISDRRGPLTTMLLGAVVGGASLLLVAAVPGSLLVFTLGFGLGASFGVAAMTLVPVGMLIDQLFQDGRKGLVYAAVMNGSAFGFMLLSPFWVWLQPHAPWSAAFAGLGWVLLMPLAWTVWRARAAARRAQLAQPSKIIQAAAGEWRGVLADSGLYALALGFLAAGATLGFLDVHLVPFWQDTHVSRTRVGASLALLGVLELASGLLTGWAALRYSKRMLLGLCYVMRALAMCALWSEAYFSRTLVFAVLFGASYLGPIILASMCCFERYGSQVKGRVFGALLLVHQLGAVLAVQGSAWCHDRFGTYEPAIIALAATTAVAALLCTGCLGTVRHGNGNRPSEPLAGGEKVAAR